MKTPSRWLLLLMLLGPPACTYSGRLEDPLVQKASWFSYLNGDDLRQGCLPDAPPRWRFVYNGRYEEQVRAYDLVGDGFGGARLVARVQVPPSLTQISSEDWLGPWRWRRSEKAVAAAELSALYALIESDGFEEPAPQGDRYYSRGFYWLVIACRQGQVKFNAWAYPQARFSALQFPSWLLARETTGIALNPARPDPFSAQKDRVNRRQDDGSLNFTITIGPNGLAHHSTLF